MTDTVATAPVDTGQATADTTSTTTPPANAAVDALTGAQPTGDGSPWYGEIEDADLRGWAENKKFADPVTALKSYRSLEGMMGQDKLSMPDPEKLTEWDGWDKLGSPKEADGYKDAVKVPDLPEGMQFDEALLAKAFDVGAQNRIPPAQMQEMVNLFAERETEAFNAAQAEMAKDKAEVDALYDEWTTAGKLDENKQHMQRFAKELGFSGEEISAITDQIGSASLLAKFADIGKRMAEGGLIGGAGGGISAEQAKAEMAKMKSDPAAQAALMDTGHAQHKEYSERFAALSAASIGA